MPRYHVLVADDDEGDRILLLWHLGRAMPRDLDMMVECAEDGAKAVEKCLSHSYSLVLMDWEMPRVAGDRLLVIIHERLSHTAVVVVSGRTRESIPLDLSLFGATFLNKNELNATRLRAAIEASMNLRARQTQGGSGLDPIQESQRG